MKILCHFLGYSYPPNHGVFCRTEVKITLLCYCLESTNYLCDVTKLGARKMTKIIIALILDYRF